MTKIASSLPAGDGDGSGRCPVSAAVDLRAAVEVLRRDGWTQGTYHRPDGCHCAEGAIAVATGQHIRGDAEGRTVGEVIAAMAAAADADEARS